MEEANEDSKLALLASIFEETSAEDLLTALNSHNGNVENAITYLSSPDRIAQQEHAKSPVKRANLKWTAAASTLELKRKSESILELHTVAQIENVLPCTIICNILPTDLARSLLKAMLIEAETWTKGYFKLFDREVTSPHVSNFYLQTQEEIDKHVTYSYNGQPIDGIRSFTKDMSAAHKIIEERTRDWLRARGALDQDWHANVAFANMYDGRDSSVGYHSDQLSFLGPLPTIASLSLGVEREFRLKPVAASIGSRTISIRLPHNSLFVMGPGCQEDYKHSIHPVGSTKGLDLHPIAGAKRINITYRKYRDEYAPDKLPKCQCGQVVLRAAKSGADTGQGGKLWHKHRYFWHCDGDKKPGGVGCKYFEWAEFDPTGAPIFKN